MRKIMICVLAFVMLGLLGCSKKEEVPEDLKNAIDKAKSEVVAEAEKADSDLWQSAERVATLVSKTVESDREYIVVFEYETSGGSTFSFEQYQKAGYIDDLWRDLCKNQIMIKILSNENAEKAQQAGESVRISRVTLLSPERNKDGSGIREVGLCDYDGDGVWDDKSISF